VNLFKNKIFRNFSVLTGASAGIQILWLLSSIRIARQLEPTGYGLVNLVSVQAALFSIISSFGLRIVIIRQIARNRTDANRLFKISNRIRLITTTIAIVVAVGYNLLGSDKSLSSSFIIVLVFTIIILSLGDSIETIAFGVEKMQASGFINLAFSAVFVAVIYLIPQRYLTISSVLYIILLNQGLKTIVYLVWLQRKVLYANCKVIPIKKEEYLEVLKQSNYYFVLAVFTALQNQVPIIFLQHHSTLDQIGIFSLGNRILSPLQLVLNTMMTALFPMFSRMAIGNIKVFAKRVKSLLNILIIVGIIGCIGFSFFSKEVVLLLYGKEYLDSAHIILIQCYYTVFFGIFCIIGMVLSSMDKQRLLAILSILYGISATPIFFYGTKYGAFGLALAFVIAAIVNMSYHWIVFRKILQKQISAAYSALIFVPLFLSMIVTTTLTVNLSLLPKIFAMIIICTISGIYLYKSEFKKISNEDTNNN